MAKSLTSAKKIAAKKTAAPKVSVRKSVRGSKEITPVLAAYSNGLANAVARGGKLGSIATEVAGLKAVAEVVALPKILDAAGEKRARTGAAKKFAGKLAAVKSPAKKKSRLKYALPANPKVLRMGAPDLPDCPEMHDFWELPIDRRFHEIIKRAGWLPSQCEQRRKKETKLMREISDRQTGKIYGRTEITALRMKLAQLREMDPPDKTLWIKELGWWEGKDKSAFHGTNSKPSANKKRGENVGQSRKGGKASTYGAGSRDKTWQPPNDDREPTTKVVCMVHECGAVVRSSRPFESRGAKGMDQANGKIVCFYHFNILIALTQSGLDVMTKAMTVTAMIEDGAEPTEDILAVAEKFIETVIRLPAKRQPPVRARAVGAVLANPVTRALLTTPISGNGHGPKDSVPCMGCGENKAPAGPRWTWKTEVHDDLKKFVDESATGRTCQNCGPSFFGLGKVVLADQPAALAQLVESKKRVAAPKPTIAYMEPSEYLAVVTGERAMKPANGNGHPPCPIPGCEMVLLKKNPYHSDVPGMEAAEGIEVCGKHMKELSQIARLQFTAERRAQLVAQVLKLQPPLVAYDDAFDEEIEWAEISGVPTQEEVEEQMNALA